MLPPADPSTQARQKQPSTELCYKTEISSLMDFNSPDASLDKGEVSLDWVQWCANYECYNVGCFKCIYQRCAMLRSSIDTLATSALEYKAHTASVKEELARHLSWRTLVHFHTGFSSCEGARQSTSWAVCSNMWLPLTTKIVSLEFKRAHS